MVAIGEGVGACANELIESRREQIQTITNLFIVGPLTRRMRSTLYLDSTVLNQPRQDDRAWVGCQLLIPRGEQFGLPTRMVATENASLCDADQQAHGVLELDCAITRAPK